MKKQRYTNQEINQASINLANAINAYHKVFTSMVCYLEFLTSIELNSKDRTILENSVVALSKLQSNQSLIVAEIEKTFIKEDEFI